ncbi:MAG: oligopeptide/dipeptide ABC transporter ATP-binding protein [Acidimicrobiales bacterium]
MTGPADHPSGSAGPGPVPAALTVENLVVEYPVPRSRTPLRAVDGLSLTVEAGSTFGLIGESGSGKSTVARAVMGLAPVAAGEIRVGGERLHGLKGRQRRVARRRVQMVFQDPHDSLDPRMTAGRSIAEPLVAVDRSARAGLEPRIHRLLERVGLDPELAGRKPYGLSGGQKQRVNIARALAPEPELLICDEAVSALDVSVQAGVLNLLLDLQNDLGLAYLFISHDIGVVAHLADVIGVMYLGRLVEVGPTVEILTRPRHPYTEALLAAEPEPVPRAYRRTGREPLGGDMPSLLNPPSGCRFRTRCPYAEARCAEETPPLVEFGPGRVACHLADSLHLSGRGPATTGGDEPLLTPAISHKLEDQP